MNDPLTAISIAGVWVIGMLAGIAIGKSIHHRYHQATCCRCGAVRVKKHVWRHQTHQPRDLAICPRCVAAGIAEVKQEIANL